MIKFKNKLVLITGASSGIGEATAYEFAKQKASIALIGRNEKRLKIVKKNVTEIGADCEYFIFDLYKLNLINDLIDNIEKHFYANISFFINSAGIGVLGLVDNVPVEEFKKNMEINFYSPLKIIQRILPMMKKKNYGQIISLFSGVGKRGLPGASSYCASKFALNGLFESLRVEVQKFNIDVILISPGLVKTNFENNLKIFGELKETFANGKKVLPEYVAKQILYASVKRKREIILSHKTKLGIHANYWIPSILDKILEKKI